MKHTDFYLEIQKIKKQEQEELVEALKAHGGSYSWYNEETKEFADEYPCIAVNVDGTFPNPTDVIIHSVSIDHREHLLFVGEDKKDSWYLVDFEADDVFAGHLSYIIDLIPETNTVDDVTTREEGFVIASVSRDDLMDAGFDAENLSDQDMQNVANVMGDFYDNYGYRDDLLEAAHKLQLAKLNHE